MAGFVACCGSIVILHQAWVSDTIICGWSSDTAVTFLQHDGEDEAGINPCFTSYGFDSRRDIGGFLGCVGGNVELGATGIYDLFVDSEPVRLRVRCIFSAERGEEFTFHRRRTPIDPYWAMMSIVQCQYTCDRHR